MDNTNVKPMRFKKITDPEEYYKYENEELKNENVELKRRLESRQRLMELREERYFKLQEKYEEVLDENVRLNRVIQEGKYKDAFEKVCVYWGDQMPMMAMEEAGEFIQAVSKLERCINDRDNKRESYTLADECDARNNLVKEMGDMIISIRALMEKYLIDRDEVDYEIYMKLRKEY